MARIPEIGGRNHKDILVKIKDIEDDAQRTIYDIVSNLIERKSNVLTDTQAQQLASLQYQLREIRIIAQEGIDLIRNAERAEEKKIYQFKKASSD